MRVLIFSTAYYPFVGGAEVAIKEITNRIGDIQFDMITARLDSKLPVFERIGNVNVYRVGFGFKHFDKWWLMKFGGWKAIALHRKNHYDVTWSMMASWGGLAAWWFSIICPKVPLVVTLQEGDEIDARKFGLVSLGWRLILSRAKVVTVISNYLREEARRYGYKGEVILVPNGVDIEKFKRQNSKGKNTSQNLREKLGFLEKDIVLITTSRLVEKNGVGDIIEALRFLPENVKLLVAGVGELEQDFKFKISNLKLENRVKMLGFVDQKNLPKYLHASDIFVRPSLSEGMGISFLEAMATGLPIIATKVGGIPDFLTHERTGLFCEVKNPKSIAEQVKRLMTDRELKDRIIAGAKATVSTYDWKYILGKMENTLKSSIGR